jgi:hypothetical protein
MLVSNNNVTQCHNYTKLKNSDLKEIAFSYIKLYYEMPRTISVDSKLGGTAYNSDV